MSEVIKVCDNYLSVKYVSHWHCLMLILPDKWPIILYGTCTKRGCIFRGKSMLCDSAAIIISLLTIAFKNIQYYCYSITFLKDLLIDIWLKNKHLMFIKFHLNNKVKVLVTWRVECNQQRCSNLLKFRIKTFKIHEIFKIHKGEIWM